MAEQKESMFRAMKSDENGWPMVGRSSQMLGIRVEGDHADISVLEDGMIEPLTGGMSVALDAAQNLPKPRRPKSLGGEGRHPVFSMGTNPVAVGPALFVRETGYPHALVEPARRCSLPEFERALTDTRQSWSKSHE